MKKPHNFWSLRVGIRLPNDYNKQKNEYNVGGRRSVYNDILKQEVCWCLSCANKTLYDTGQNKLQHLL